MSPAQVATMSTSDIYHWWRDYCKDHAYDYQTHLQYTESVEKHGHLPASMMLFAPCSNNPDVWTDIVRIKTLNTDLSRKTTEHHVCPLQLDVIERLIERYSNPGDVILDPFGGVMSVPYQAIKMRRIGWGIELSSQYHGFGVSYCERAENKLNAPTLFDMFDDDEPDCGYDEPIEGDLEDIAAEAD